jgi:uncharacterized protein DUF922
MRPGLVRMFYVLLFFLASSGAALAQPYRQLSTEDFRGAPNPSQNNIAYTSCYIDLQYNVSNAAGRYKLTFDPRLVMDAGKSWIDLSRITSSAILTEVLKHEQGHYTIAYFELRELLHDLERSSFDKDYKAEVSDIFNRIHEKYTQLNIDYDEDTNHSMNRVQQASWDKYFHRELDRYYASMK